MRPATLAALAVVAFLMWDLRRRFALALIDENDQAPDVFDWANQAAELVTWSPPADDTMVFENNERANEQAFLAAITRGEGTEGPDGYYTLMGGGTFTSEVDHPASLGWSGTKLSDAMCKAAGFRPGCVSTAAGKYQINRPTWLRVKARLSLPDFSPSSQDAAALFLIQEKGALTDVREGRIDQAVRKVRSVWASLPGAGYGQHEVGIETVKQAFLSAGGTLA